MIRKHDYSDLITVIVVNNLCNHKMQVFNAFYIAGVGRYRISSTFYPFAEEHWTQYSRDTFYSNEFTIK